MTNTDADFYTTLGPFLSRREIAKEIGGPIYDDQGKLWFVALDSGKVVGFAALIRGKVDHFCSDFVIPENRKKRIHDRLMTERIGVCGDLATATVTPAAKKAYLRHGFKEISAKGKFSSMRRERKAKS